MQPANILLIHVDQHRFDCVGANGHPAAHTPNLDRLAAEGVNFTHAFCPIAVCMPARTSLMTGLYATQHGCLVNDGVEGYCPACSEVLLDREQGDRYSELVGAFQRQVNAAFVAPGFITEVRKKLALDQREAAEIFGGGVNAFSRYETGKTRPPLALVKLLKVLDRHPELLAEVRS